MEISTVLGTHISMTSIRSGTFDDENVAWQWNNLLRNNNPIQGISLSFVLPLGGYFGTASYTNIACMDY